MRIRRDGDTSTEIVEASLPAVVSVTDQINEPRYPSFKGIMAAKKKPLQTWSLADLGVAGERRRPRRRLDHGGRRSPRARRGRPARSSTDEGDGGTKLVEYLAGAKLV